MKKITYLLIIIISLINSTTTFTAQNINIADIIEQETKPFAINDLNAGRTCREITSHGYPNFRSPIS